ncbi:hypothetical protein TNCV_791201 [Trichonephila clavipes]|nr:hypothetical protein TNCV_791201 [Trichonephila clavipes]
MRAIGEGPRSFVNHGQVTRTTHELPLTLSELPNFANGRTLSLDRFSVDQPFYRVGFQGDEFLLTSFHLTSGYTTTFPICEVDTKRKDVTPN